MGVREAPPARDRFRMGQRQPAAVRAFLFALPGSLNKHVEYLIAPIVLAVVAGAWQYGPERLGIPRYLLPSPAVVWAKLLTISRNGTLWPDLSYTLKEAMIGLAVSLIFAAVTGYLLAKAPLLERLASPYLVAAQTVPLLAVAPLLVVWFGFGMTSKIIIAAIIVFFPFLVSIIVGIRGVDPDQRELMRSYCASPWHVLTALELPSAMPVLLGGLKIAVTMALTGAMVGEYVGSNRGLGHLILNSKLVFDSGKVLAAIVVVMLVNVVLYSLVAALEAVLLAWRRQQDGE